MTDSDAFILERTFAAPAASVWNAWTDPKLLPRWYKPNNKCETSVLRHDVRVGGVLLYQMQFGQMPPHIERWEFAAIEEPTRLQWLQMLSDADGNPVPNKRMPDWPKVMLTTIDLIPQDDGGTLQRLTWIPHDATDTEWACFRASSEQLGGGWAGGLANLAAFLEGSAE